MALDWVPRARLENRRFGGAKRWKNVIMVHRIDRNRPLPRPNYQNPPRNRAAPRSGAAPAA